MGLLKSFFAAPRTTLERPQQGQRLLVPMRAAGVVVDYETALKYSAVWRCISLISSTIATLPWHVFETAVVRGRVVRNQVSMNHPVDWMLHRQANPEMSSIDFRQFVLAWALLNGNGYAEIERDRAGRVLWMWPITPDRVSPDRDSKGSLIYQVSNGSGPNSDLPANDVYHLKGLGFDGRVGYSVISLAAKSIGLGLAAEEFGASYFQNGITPSGVLEHPKNLGPDAYQRLKDSLTQEHGNGPKHAYKPLILEEGMVWKTISAKPEEAQFLENRRFQIGDIARWYGVPMVLLEEKDASTWGSGIEQILIAFEKFGLRPWVHRSESEADIKLFGVQQRGRLITKLNMNALVRGDLATRREWYKAMRDLGVLSVNDIRELEDMNPIGPEGDKRLVPLNMTTLEKAGEEPPKPSARPVDSSEANGDNGDGDVEPGETAAEPSRAAAFTAQREALVAVFDHVNHYEAKRCAQFCMRYSDRSSFVTAMDKFYHGQARDLRGRLQPLVSALISLAGAHAHADTVVEQHVEKHIQWSRLAMLSAFDSGGALMACVQSESAAQQIIEAIL